MAGGGDGAPRGLRGKFADRVFRAFLFAALSLTATVVFAGYNVFLWFAYGTAWNIGIAVYYCLLVAIRAHVLFGEKRARRAELPEAQREAGAAKRFFVQSIFLLAIDIALIAPISLMVMQKKEVRYSAIPAIAMAAYTTYKIVLAALNYGKNRRQTRLSMKMFGTLNLVDALVSVLTLQYALVMTFGEGVSGEMLTWCAISSFAVWAAIVVISFLTALRAVKLRRQAG